MFSLRVYNPYENMPGSSIYRVPNEKELLKSLEKANTLYDVSLYLAEKIEMNWDERLLRKQTRAKNFFSTLTGEIFD